MMMYIQSKICFSTNIVTGVRAIIKIQDELSSVIHHYCVSSRERESRQSEPLTHRRTSLRFADTSRATLFFAGNYPLSSPDSPPSFHDTCTVCSRRWNKSADDYHIAARVAIPTRVDGYLTLFFFFPKSWRLEMANLCPLPFPFFPSLLVLSSTLEVNFAGYFPVYPTRTSLRRDSCRFTRTCLRTRGCLKYEKALDKNAPIDPAGKDLQKKKKKKREL